MGESRKEDIRTIRLLAAVSSAPFMIIAGTFIGAILAKEWFGQSYEALGIIIGAFFFFFLTIVEIYNLAQSGTKKQTELR